MTQPGGAGNPKQIRIGRNGAMGKREAVTFLRRLRAISTIAVQIFADRKKTVPQASGGSAGLVIGGNSE
jgi:hypothetical protein